MAYLLLLLALPQALKTPYGSVLPKAVGHEEIEIVVMLLLKTIGFYALYKAADAACAGAQRIRYKLVVGIPLLVYWFLEVGYAGTWFRGRLIAGPDAVAMTPFFLWAFALIKVITTMTFVPAVLLPYAPFKHLSLVDKILAFLHIETEDVKHRRRHAA